MTINNNYYSAICVLAIALGISACQSSPKQMTSNDAKPTILEAYASQALDVYSDALKDAQQLQVSIQALAESPSSKQLQKTKDAWLNSRESYGQTEIFRLSNGPIDAEEGWVADAYNSLEGQINAWPLDENMIDYSIDENGKRTSGNIIDSSGSFNPGGEDAEAVQVTTITAEALAALNENGGDANVASGYHAIEFLLWGQDQDYANFSMDSVTKGALTAGQRPIEDFTVNPHADRRLQYLQAAAQKLVDDLSLVNSAWSKEISNNCDSDATGCYRGALLGLLKDSDAGKNIPQQVAMRQIISGMGVFIKSELANERIAVAVLTPSEEDEHSCFSDNTHRDITLNYQGFVNVLKAQYNNKDYGPSFYTQSSSDTQARLDTLIAEIDAKIKRMNHLAENKWHFDYQILPQNNARELRKMKNEMRKLGDLMVAVAGDLNISLTTGDVTDSGETKL